MRNTILTLTLMLAGCGGAPELSPEFDPGPEAGALDAPADVLVLDAPTDAGADTRKPRDAGADTADTADTAPPPADTGRKCKVVTGDPTAEKACFDYYKIASEVVLWCPGPVTLLGGCNPTWAPAGYQCCPFASKVDWSMVE